MLRNGHGGIYKAPTTYERRHERLRGGGDRIKFIDLRVERGKVLGFWKGRRRQDQRSDLSIKTRINRRKTNTVEDVVFFQCENKNTLIP